MYKEGEFHKSLSRGEKTVESSCAHNKNQVLYSWLLTTLQKMKVMVIYAKILQKEGKLAASLYGAKQLSNSIGKSQMIQKEG